MKSIYFSPLELVDLSLKYDDQTDRQTKISPIHIWRIENSHTKNIHFQISQQKLPVGVAKIHLASFIVFITQ